MKYDYIIAGSGCAGLSLLYRILLEPDLKDQKILVLDRAEKNLNDRTWCFWEKGEGLFEPILYHQWKTLEFISDDFTRKFDLKEYAYKMLQSIDFYNYVINFAKSFSNVDFKYESIIEIKDEAGQGVVITKKTKYLGQYIFNSTELFYPKMDASDTLLQHFEGWVIETPKPVFNNEVGTLMDFRLEQNHGTTFMYVLPTKPNEALIEYTLFSAHTLNKEDYEKALKNYIKNHIRIENYEIKHKESGAIPMSLAKFPNYSDTKSSIIHMGTAGGFTKASSGYTFQFIQENANNIVSNLKNHQFPGEKKGLRDKMFQWYDRTLLEVIMSNKMTGKEIFTIMFSKLPPERILAFLGNHGSFIDDLKIMNSVPTPTFFKAALKQLKW